MASNKSKVVDKSVVDKIVNEYNKHVASWNEHEERAHAAFISDDLPVGRFKCNGAIEVTQLNGSSKRSIGVFFHEEPHILYTIVIKGCKVWLTDDSHIKNTIKMSNIANVWKEVVGTWIPCCQ